jgi:hypothetical protein
MKTLRNIEKEINPDDPFEDCELEREKYADNLTRIIENYPSGFVMALNNRWGDGKTFFVNRWRQKLKNEGFQVVYYNAWEDDYSENALVSIIGEITEDIETPNKKLLEKLIEKGTGLFVRSLPIFFKAFAKKIAGKEGYEDFAELIGDELGKPFQNLIDDYKKQKNTVKEFRNALQNFAFETGNDKPIVIFIDELDRCKPSYAVEVLEIIKHLFSVDNIVFVLSVDKEQLANSIRGYYGSDHIDGNEYLKRFIDLEFSLPNPKLKSFITFNYNKLEFEKALKGDRMNFPDLKNDNEYFLAFTSLFFEEKNLNLRQINRIMTQVRVVMYSFKNNEFMLPSLLLLLVYLKVEDSEEYQKIKKKELNYSELLSLNSKLTTIKLNLDNGKLPYVININEWYLYSLYANYIGDRLYDEGIKIGKEEFTEKFRDQSFDSGRLYELLTFSIERNRFSSLSLEFLLNKIELSETLKFNI